MFLYHVFAHFFLFVPQKLSVRESNLEFRFLKQEIGERSCSVCFVVMSWSGLGSLAWNREKCIAFK